MRFALSIQAIAGAYSRMSTIRPTVSRCTTNIRKAILISISITCAGTVFAAVEQIRVHDTYVLTEAKKKEEIPVINNVQNERGLKVYESCGYNYKPTPSIVLKGEWLKNAGFTTGAHIVFFVKIASGR